MAVQLHEDFDKLNAITKIIDNSIDYANAASPNLWTMISDAQALLADTVNPQAAQQYTASLETMTDNFNNTVINQLNVLNIWVSQALATIAPAPSTDTAIQALIKGMADGRIITGVTTMTQTSTAVTGVGTAFESEVAAGDYLFREEDGRSYAIRVASVTSDTALVLASNYLGTTGSGEIVIERTIQSRNVTKTLTYSPSTSGNKAKIIYNNDDRYGFDREGFRNAGNWQLKPIAFSDYSGVLNLAYLESISEKGNRDYVIDPNGARFGEQIGIVIQNPYNTRTILKNGTAHLFPYSTGSGSDIQQYGWYSSDFTNVAVVNDTFKHAKPNTRQPSNWTAGGSGSSLEVTGNFAGAILVYKENLNDWTPYVILMDYKYASKTDSLTTTIGCGTNTVSTTGQAVLTGNVDFTNGNTTVTGTGTSFLSELTPGDHIRATAHAAASATEIASIESDTSLTLVAGGYLGATTGGAVGSTRHETGWHTLELDLGYKSDFITEDDIELDLEISSYSAGTLHIDNYTPTAYTILNQIGTALIIWAGEEDIDKDDYWNWNIEFVGTDSVNQRWFAEQFNGQTLPHRSTNPTFADYS